MTGAAFAMLGDPDAVACEGDACLVPGAAPRAQESRVAPAPDAAAAASPLSAPGR